MEKSVGGAHYADSCSVASRYNATGSAPKLQTSFLSHHSFGLDPPPPATVMMMMIAIILLVMMSV